MFTVYTQEDSVWAKQDAGDGVAEFVPASQHFDPMLETLILLGVTQTIVPPPYRILVNDPNNLTLEMSDDCKHDTELYPGKEETE